MNRLQGQTSEGAMTVAGPGGRRVFSRMGRNIGWLLGGRGFAGAVSIGYLAFAARALGPVAFGTFSLILAYGASIANLVQFQSWQAVIRFGAVHMADRQEERLARLFGFSAMLDWSGAILGALVAIIGVRIAAPLLGWTAEQGSAAAMFSAVLLLFTSGTATGVLRLYDRFDLLTYAEAIGPGTRFVGAGVAWALGGGLNAMLAVWALAALAEWSAHWIAAIAGGRVRLRLGRAAAGQALAENPRIGGFIAQTSFSSSLGLIWQQAGTLAVGGYAGPAAAGAFRVASKLAGALAKPADTVTRVLYPELARLVAAHERDESRRVALRMTWIAVALAAAIVVLVWLAGPLLLTLFSGNAFDFAQPYLMLLTVAAAIDLCGVALEPILNAHGFSGRILAARVIGAASYLLALFVLLPALGPTGAAVAAIVSSVVIRGALALSSWRVVAGDRVRPVRERPEELL